MEKNSNMGLTPNRGEGELAFSVPFVTGTGASLPYYWTVWPHDERH